MRRESMEPADEGTAPHTEEASASRAEGISLAERAYRALEELIVTAELPPGAALSEQALARRLGIGRTPIREALQRLAYEGLVVILPRRGILISEVNVSRQLKTVEFRREVERLMVRAAVYRASEAECAQFADIAEALERVMENRDGQGFMRLDQRMNLLLAYCARNEFASKAIGLVRGLTRRFWYLNHSVEDLVVCARLHAALARAIAARRGDKATEACEELVDYIEDFTRGTLDSQRIP